MPIQRPWMQDLGDQPCGKCAKALAGPVSGLGWYDHVHEVSKVPRRRVANRQWVCCTGWAVACTRIPAWVFFAELDAAVVFARAGMQTGDLGTVEIRHAYTELIFAGELFGPARRFLGLAGPAGRSLYNDRLLQSWIDKQIPDRDVLDDWAS